MIITEKQYLEYKEENDQTWYMGKEFSSGKILFHIYHIDYYNNIVNYETIETVDGGGIKSEGSAYSAKLFLECHLSEPTNIRRISEVISRMEKVL